MRNPLLLIFCLVATGLKAQNIHPVAIQQVDSLILLSRTQTDQNDFDKALETSALAEDLALKTGGTMSAAFGNTCFNHGRIMHFKGNYREAEIWYLRAKNIREKVLGTAHEDYGKSVNNLAIVYDLMRRHEEAIPLYQQAFDIRKQLFGEESKPCADVLSNLGTSYEEMGDYELAERFTQKALRIRERVLGKNAPEYAASLVNLANLYHITNNFDQAVRLYQQANDILAQNDQSESEQYALGLDNLGTAYLKMGRLEEAENNYLKAKALREKRPDISTVKHVDIFQHLGVLYDQKGQPEAALKWYMEAKTLGENVLDKNHPDYILTLESLGVLFLNQKNLEKAKAFLLAAHDGYAQTLGKDHPNYCVRMVVELTRMYVSAGDLEAAKLVFMESSAAKRKLLFNATHHLSEREMAAYTREFTKSLDMGFALAMQQPDDLSANCYDDILFYKGFLLQSALQLRKSALRDSATTAMYHLLKSCHRRLAHEYAKPLAERQIAANLEAEANDIEKQLAHSVARYGEGIQQVTWQAVQARLKTNEAALEFVRFDLNSINAHATEDSIYYAALLLLPEDESPRFFALFPEKQLVALLSSTTPVRAATYNNLYASDKKGRQLYDMIWQPIAAALPDNAVVYYAPSGLLHRLNLGAIPTPDGQMLANKYNLTTVGSTRQMVIPTILSTPQNASAQLYGGIQYAATPAMASVSPVTFEDFAARRGSDFDQNAPTLRGDTLKYLHWTNKEIAAAAAVMTGKGIATTLKKGAEATEESFKSIGQNSTAPRILHVATHGFFFPDPLVGAPSPPEAPSFKVSENPMIRSGLVLAGGNHAWKTGKTLRPNLEDGILTAYEISQMDLANTELVVLSACETGLGDLVGNEGVYGLQRAFKIAGARYLIMSLWQVPELQTQVFMTTFYQHWLNDNMAIPAAFRTTQSDMKARYGDAYRWAGFVLVE